MTVKTNQDPWVKAHKEMMSDDPGYAEYVKTYKRDTNRIVKRYMMRSNFKFIGIMVIILGLGIGLTHLGFLELTSDSDYIGTIFGKYGSGDQMAALVNVFGFSIFMPVILAIGIYILYSGLRNDHRIKMLDYCTRMVEGYRAGVDPAKMKRPKRY